MNKDALPEIPIVLIPDGQGGYDAALPVDEMPVKLVCITKKSSVFGDFWTWVAKHGTGRVSTLTLNARYHFNSYEFTFRARVNGGKWFIIEDSVQEDRIHQLRILFGNAMTKNRYFDTYQEILLTQGGFRKHVGFGVQ